MPESSLTTTLYDRRTDDVIDLPGLTLNAQFITKRAGHVCVGAEITATVRGDHPKQGMIYLLKLLDTFGQRVWCETLNGEYAWDGYIHSIEFDVGGLRFGKSLDQTATVLRAVWQLPGTGEEMRATLTDATWEQVIGTKEILVNLGTRSSSDARAALAALLADSEDSYKGPRSTGNGFGDRSGRMTATIQARGLDDTLNWTLVDPDPRDTTPPTYGNSEPLPWGNSANVLSESGQVVLYGPRPSVAQIIVAPLRTGTALSTITVNVTREENGPAFLDVELRNATDSVMVPGSVVYRSWTIPLTAVATGAMTLVVDPPVPLSAGQRLWVRLIGIGNVDPTAGLEVATAYTNTGLSLSLYQENTWLVPFSGIAMQHTLGWVRDSMHEARHILTPVPERFTTITTPATGVVLAPLMQYDTPRGEYLKTLIAARGTGPRYELDIDEQQRLNIRTRPRMHDPLYTMWLEETRSGALRYDSERGMVDVATCPVGVWLDRRSTAPLEIGEYIGELALQYVTSARYDAMNREYVPEFG